MEFRRAHNPIGSCNSDESDHFVGDSDQDLSAEELVGKLRAKVDDRAEAVLHLAPYSNTFCVIYDWVVCRCFTISRV